MSPKGCPAQEKDPFDYLWIIREKALHNGKVQIASLAGIALK